MIEGSLLARAGRVTELDTFGFFAGNVVGDAVTLESKIIEHFALKTDFLNWRHTLVAARSRDFNFGRFVLEHLNDKLGRYFICASLRIDQLQLVRFAVLDGQTFQAGLGLIRIDLKRERGLV